MFLVKKKKWQQLIFKKVLTKHRLDEEETDIKKITDVTHNVLMAMSVRDAVCIIKEKKKNGEILSEEDEIKLVSELVTKCYEEKLDFIKKSLLN